MRIPFWKKTKPKKDGSNVWRYVLPDQFRFYLIADSKPITVNLGPVQMEFQYDRDINLGRIRLLRISGDFWKIIVDSRKPLRFEADAIFIPLVLANAREIGIEAEDYHKPIALIIGSIIALWKVIGWIRRK